MPRLSRLRIGTILLMVWGVALIVFLFGLGNVPIRDWDEGIVARVALENSWSPWPDRLLPTFWGAPYLNKPPGLHWLIGGAMAFWRALAGRAVDALPPEWLVRLVPAFLSSLIVPLVGLLQLRLRPSDRTAVVTTALMALTLLPLGRHGRLAMLDGAQLCAALILWLGLLMVQPGRSPLGGGLVAGLAGSALLLLKAPVVLPVLLAGLLLRWLDGDLSGRAWAAAGLCIAIGLAPGLAWHGWHWLQRGDAALLMWGSQGLLRATTTVEEHHGNPFLPLVEVLEGGWPWLPLWPLGLVRCWRERGTRAGRWCLGLTLATTLMVLPLRTQLPWYSLLLWPPFCLVAGPVLADLLHRTSRNRVLMAIPRLWCVLGGLLLAAVALSFLPVAGLPPELATIRLLPVPAALGLLSGGILLAQSTFPARRLGLVLLTAGWCLSLLAFFRSPLWNWELNEIWPVGPAVELIRGVGPPDQEPSLPIYMVGDDAERPSLRWYAQRLVRRLPLLPSSDLPPRYVLILRPPPMEEATGRRILPLENGSLCRWETTGDQNWQRWRCQAPAESEGSDR